MNKCIPCKRCSGRGFIDWTCFKGSFVCPDCNGSGFLVASMTNADRIRAMSDEELAGFLHQVRYDHRWGLKEYAIEWLQRPSGEEDKHEPN